MSDFQTSIGTNSSASALTKIKMSSYYSRSANYFIKAMKETENSTPVQTDKFCSYAIFSIIATVMCLEAYVNEVLSDTIGIHSDLPKAPPGNILVEYRLRKLYQIKGITNTYSLTDDTRNLIYLRNEFVHYDDEAIGSDVIPVPVGRREENLNNVLIYFKQLIDNGTIPRSKVYPDSDLFPLGLLSSAFSEWATNTITLEINRIISKVGSRPL